MKLQPERGVAMALVALALAACSTITPYPDDWPAATVSGDWCRHPAGAFAVSPARSSDADEPPLGSLLLKEVFFGGLLNGFAVTHLTFETLDSGDLRVRAWVDDVVLEEQRRVEPSGRACDDDRWRVSTGWGLDGYAATAGLVWTGGIVIPAASERHFLLNRTADGDLVVRFRSRTAGTLFFFFPFRTVDEDVWFLYPALRDDDA